MLTVIFLLIFFLSLIDIIFNHSIFNIQDFFFDPDHYFDKIIEELERQEEEEKKMFKYFKEF